MFAVSGLAAWLIDNWPPRKSICFLLIFIPAVTFQLSSRFPGPREPSSRAMLGSGNSFPQTPKTPRSGEKARTRRVARWILEEPLGASRRRRQADWSPLAPRLGAAGLAQCSCSQLASARTKGLPGAADRVRLGARGRKGLSGESASSEGLGWPPPATARGPASCQAKTEESQSPLTPSGRMAAVRLGIPHTHPPSRKPKGLALGNNHQKSLCGPFSQPMSDPAMV